ncbi:MAG: DUF4298 domain-containing protein [Weeksellaceae bacterium]|nr:DUF4298 domain-containing protein [Weeksellaceae bacterium]
MEDHLKETEKLLLSCEMDLKTLKDIHQQLIIIEERRKLLENYYTHQYMEDYEKNHDPESSHSRVLDQDSIWNVLSDQYTEKIQILKSIIQTI